MKNLINVQKMLLATMFFLFNCMMVNAQWTGNSTTGPTMRSGNTGIGTFDPTGPQAYLHLRQGGINTEQTLLRMQTPDKQSFGTHIWDTNVSSSGTYSLTHRSNSTSPATRVTLEMTGRFGLSETSPEHMLHVNGDGKFNTNLYVNNRLGIGTTSPSALLTVSSPSDPIIRLERSEGQNHDWEIYSQSGGGLYFRGGGDGSGTSGTQNWGVKMALTSNGRLGIGTNGLPPDVENANGDSYNLYVTGGIITEEVKIELEADWADYVFENDYELLPLEEVENHIISNGYLPNTPSAKTIEEDGLELGAMTILQQEKIEELFLHAIEMDKKMKKLEAENNDLKAKLSAIVND